MDKIYTKKGDQGRTMLGTGEVVPKTEPVVAAYGSVDELSSFVGLALTECEEHQELAEELLWVQRRLFTIASLLAFPGYTESKVVGELSEADVKTLEQAIDRIDLDLPPLKSFILPGGCRLGALLHYARTVCRRTEREVTALDMSSYPLGENILPFLNRLSDYLFSAARVINQRNGSVETPARES